MLKILKFLLLVALTLVLFVPVSVNADRSAILTDDGSIATGGGLLTGLIVTTDGTNDVTIVLYDHATSASGNQILPTITVLGGVYFFTLGYDIADNITFHNGVYADFTCSGTFSAQGYYAPD